MTQPKPMRARPVFWLSVVILVAAVGGSFGIWYLFLRPSGPPPVSISSIPTASAPAAASFVPGSTSSAAIGAASSGGTGSLDGTWTVDTGIGSFSDFTNSFAGYRVQEQLASIGANTAVGRTPKVTGSITLKGTMVTAGAFTADLTALQSDDDRRDGQLRRQGIQTAQFPTATFNLTKPIDLGALPADGQALQATATGDFTLHGVTKSVQLQVTAKRSGSVIVVTGSLPVSFADYGIGKPNSFLVLSIDDHGTMEFQLLFTKR